MSVKKKGLNIIASSSLRSLERDIESGEYITPYLEDQERLIPHIDFTKPKNFVKFGSAKQYYHDSISRIYNTYPYDGSLAEKIEWEIDDYHLQRLKELGLEDEEDVNQYISRI